MTDPADASSSATDAAAQRASDQARLRRERREAKIKARGADRLNKITGIGGRVVGDAEQSTPAAPAAAAETETPPSPEAAHHDPEEVDISQHFYAPGGTPPPLPRRTAPGPEPTLSEAHLRQMMLGHDRTGTPNPGAQDDPVMKMLARMMGGAGGPPPGVSPAMAPPSTAPSSYNTVWRLVHALLALTLGLYLTLLTPFTGTKVERDTAAQGYVAIDGAAANEEHERHKRTFLWLFATSEAVLLTTRFLLDKGRAPPEGFLWTILGLVPEPVRGYLTVGLRYGQIFSTARGDILMCVFVLGVCSLVRG